MHAATDGYIIRVVIRRWNTLQCGKGMQADLARAVYVCAKARTR